MTMTRRIRDVVRINCSHAGASLTRLDAVLDDGSRIDVVLYYDHDTDTCLYYYPPGQNEPYPGFEDELVRLV